MKKIVLSVLIVTGLSAVGFSQATTTWKDLADVDFEMRFFEEYEQQFLVPLFGKIPKEKEGTEVSISGYMIPLDANLYALSQYPYAACFFCGSAGPETIVELQLKPEAQKRYKMDQKMTFKGILRLNDSDVMHFNYILENAEPASK
jgi:hypothetical protein